MNTPKILFVEDHPLNREVITEYLELQECQVCALADGSDFLSSVANFKPDLLLLDLKLSHGVDGFTLMRQLNQSRWSQIPIIVLSALCFNRDKERAFKMGAKRFLVKPVTLYDLKQTIQEELKSNPYHQSKPENLQFHEIFDFSLQDKVF